MTALPTPPGMVVSREDTTVRMFRSDLLEKLSHVHPAVPHVLYLPTIAAALLVAERRGVTPFAAVGLFVGGLLAWSLVEYVVHRFAFHVREETERNTFEAVRRLSPDRPVMPALAWREKVYFVMHGVHHLFPNDSRRLVMPPSVSVPLAIAFYLLFRATLGAVWGPALFAGFVMGYLFYDTTHFVVHHHRCRGRWSAMLKKWHMRHHFLDSERGFGVSSPLWDYLFGTAARPAGRVPGVIADPDATPGAATGRRAT
jgi:sterol desaturase/sphingolipid hydroxylase (fatty acid hydroxylase superfamily)